MQKMFTILIIFEVLHTNKYYKMHYGNKHKQKLWLLLLCHGELYREFYPNNEQKTEEKVS